MSDYKYREYITDREGTTTGYKEIVVPNKVVEQIRAELLKEYMMKDCTSCEVHLREQIRVEAIDELLEMSKKTEYGFCTIERLCEIYFEQLKEQNTFEGGIRE